MRIGVVTTSYPRNDADFAGRFVAALNRYLIRCGHSVEVLAAGEAGPTPGAAEEIGDIPVVRIPSPLFYKGGAPDALLASPKAVFEAVRYCAKLAHQFRARQQKYDAIVSHWLVPCGLIAAALADGRPHVAVAHSSDIHLLRRLELAALVRYIARRARLIYTSAALRIPGAPGQVVPMGLDVAEFRASAGEREAARRRLEIDAPTVLFLGRLVPVKGVEVLLRALDWLPEVKLLVAGDGPLAASLRAQAGERARFFGEVGKALRKELLLGCDALAVPSLVLPDGRTEGAPQVVLEGLAAGCSVVASATGGIPELVGDAGWLVPPNDAPALAQALGQAIVSSEKRSLAVARAGAFDWSVLAPRILGPLSRL